MSDQERAIILAAEVVTEIVNVLRQHAARLDAIEQTREQPERKVPQPLTQMGYCDEADPLDITTPMVANLAGKGLGIYRISEVEATGR